MAKQPQGFTPISLKPLSGLLDTRSRMEDSGLGVFRYKLNFSVDRTGQLSQRSGFGALDFGQRLDSDTAVNNWDLHRQDGQRELPTLLFESKSTSSVRRLMAGTQSNIFVMDGDTSEWTKIASGLGAAGSRFKAAGLGDKVYFTNNVNEPIYHELGSSTSAVIPELQARQTTKAKLVLEFGGVIVWMNLVEDGEDQTSRVRWSNYKDGLAYDPSTTDTVASFQDLDYGDPILAAIQLYNSVYIFTECAIWRMVINVSADSIFGFTRIHVEPKNKTGCIAYPNTLVSNGKELYWWARDSIWTYNPYIIGPEIPEWLLKSCGHVFSADNSDRLEKRCCESPIGEYHPDTQEIWFSYPLASSLAEPLCLNNRSLVLNHKYQTADIVDHGFGAMVNFSIRPESDQVCNSSQYLLASSGEDYCLKAIGTVFYREMVTLIDDEANTDIPDDSYSVEQRGYYRRIVGMCPFAYPNNNKALNGIELVHDTKPDDNVDANLVTLRIGNSFHLADPMAIDGKCSVQWHDQESIELKCSDEQTMTQLANQGMRPSDPTSFNVWEEGRYLYYDFRIVAANGGAPIGSDSAWSEIKFSVAVTD